MPFDGSGNYVPPSPPTFPAVSGTTIQSAYFNAVINDIATALTDCITKDGQSTPSANIKLNGFNLTNVGTPSNPTDAANKSYVDGLVVGLLDFKGSTDCSSNPNYPAALKGDAYIVSVAGKIGGASGISVSVGAMFFASADNAGGTQAAVGASWDILVSTTGFLVAANNLSDLVSAATARTNIGLPLGTSGATVPLLNGANTWSGGQTFNAFGLFNAGIDLAIPLAGPTTTEAGYMGSPINTQNGTYSTIITDRGKTIYHTSGSAHTFTIDDTLAYSIGTIIAFNNENAGGVVTIAINNSAVLRWGALTGSRSLAANGQAQAQKMSASLWRLTGSGIS